MNRATSTKGTALGRDLISSAMEILRSLKTGDTSKIILRRVEVVDLRKYLSRDVKALRK
jgi:hypothetical protein